MLANKACGDLGHPETECLRRHRNCRKPQEVTIQCPNRKAAGTQRDDGDQVLQAIKFTDKKVPGLHLDLDEDFQAAGCFREVIRGYKMGVVAEDQTTAKNEGRTKLDNEKK